MALTKAKFKMISNLNFPDKTIKDWCIIVAKWQLFENDNVVKRKDTIITFDTNKMKINKMHDNISIDWDKWVYSIEKIIWNFK